MIRFSNGLAAIAILLTSVPAGSAESLPPAQRAFRYTDWPFDERGSVLIFAPTDDAADGALLLGGEIEKPAEFCPKTSAFVCFVTDDYAFAIPRDWRPNTKSWVYRGIRFDVLVTDKRLTLFGKEYNNLVVIRQSPGSTTMSRARQTENFYVYSVTMGLLAFGSRHSSTFEFGPTAWLAEGAGFGAISPPPSTETPQTPTETDTTRKP